MSAHPFLSPEWIAAVKEIRDEYSTSNTSAPIPVAANVIITSTPFGDDVRGHLDARGSSIMIEEGSLDKPDFTLEMPYDLAKQIFVERDPNGLIPVLFGGKVKLTGDSSKILLLAGAFTPPEPGSEAAAVPREVLARIDEITA